VTISSLGGIFAKVYVLVQSDCRQVSVMTSLGKEIFESRVLGRGRHQIIQDYHALYSGSKKSSLSSSIGMPRRNSTRGTS
jgi:hypothetical protein